MANYRITITDSELKISYIMEHSEETSLIEALKSFRTYAIRVAKELGMEDFYLTIEEA